MSCYDDDDDCDDDSDDDCDDDDDDCDDDSDSGDDSDSDEDGDSNDDEDGDGNEIKVLFTTIITLSTIYGIIIIIISWSFLQTSSSLNLSR